MGRQPLSIRANFRQFFLRGLTILLPTVLTIWILIAAYAFVQQRIAEPINAGVRTAAVYWSPWPTVYESELHAAEGALTTADRAAWQAAGGDRQWLRRHVRAAKVAQLWSQYQFPMDLIGLGIAVLLIYSVGLVVGSFIGHRLYARGEHFVQRLPLVRQVYPAVKQITDFLFGGTKEELKFNRVVAVEYPRKGIWSVGLVTGPAFKAVAERTDVECLTVFVPSSPTPFTGYTVMVPVTDTVDLPVSIEDALRYTVSGGVVLPPSQIQEMKRLLPRSPGVKQRASA